MGVSSQQQRLHPSCVYAGLFTNNHGNYIVRLGNFVSWLGQEAEALGVDIYTGIAATEVGRADRNLVS